MESICTWFEARFSPDVVLRIATRGRLCSVTTPYQTIEVYDTLPFGRILVLDQVINVAERDEFIYHEMLCHVPLFVHPHPESVLVVGGGDGGTVREAVKHNSVRHVELVEIDQAVVDVSRRYLPSVSGELDNPKVRITYEDAAQFVKKTPHQFDVIIVDSTDPVGAGAVLFSEDFYRDCRALMDSHGILTAQSESPFFDPQIVRSLYATARSVFPVVRMYTAFVPSYVSGLWSFLFCSLSVDPVVQFHAERVMTAMLDLKYYSPEIHRASFVLPPFVWSVLNESSSSSPR